MHRGTDQVGAKVPVSGVVCSKYHCRNQESHPIIGHQINVAHTQQVNNQFGEQQAHTRAGGEKGSYSEQTIGVRK